MNKKNRGIYAKIMFYLDRHLDGEILSWHEYDTLINMLLAEHGNIERGLHNSLDNLNARVEKLKETVCLLSSKEPIKRARQRLQKKSKDA